MKKVFIKISNIMGILSTGLFICGGIGIIGFVVSSIMNEYSYHLFILSLIFVICAVVFGIISTGVLIMQPGNPEWMCSDIETMYPQHHNNVKCRSCNGTGRCQNCRGTGEAGWNGLKGNGQVCPVCLGTGVCRKCTGTGRT